MTCSCSRIFHNVLGDFKVFQTISKLSTIFAGLHLHLQQSHNQDKSDQHGKEKPAPWIDSPWGDLPVSLHHQICKVLGRSSTRGFHCRTGQGIKYIFKHPSNKSALYGPLKTHLNHCRRRSWRPCSSTLWVLVFLEKKLNSSLLEALFFEPWLPKYLYRFYPPDSVFAPFYLF